MTNYKFSIGEIIDDIVSFLENKPFFYGSELHHEVFNTDYYIIGTFKAKEALNEYGAFDAIGEIVEYEKFNFGEVLTDVSEPEKVANMLYYIKANEFLAKMNGGYGVEGDIHEILDENWNNQLEEEDVLKLLEHFKGMQEDYSEAY